jgi:hypothetical protein
MDNGINEILSMFVMMPWDQFLTSEFGTQLLHGIIGIIGFLFFLVTGLPFLVFIIGFPALMFREKPYELSGVLIAIFWTYAISFSILGAFETTFFSTEYLSYMSVMKLKYWIDLL